jgi:hypothetical protein
MKPYKARYKKGSIDITILVTAIGTDGFLVGTVLKANKHYAVGDTHSNWNPTLFKKI